MNAIGKSRIAELLVQQGLVTHQQVDEAVAALTHYKAGRKKLSQILLEKGFVTETALTDVLSTHLGIPQIAPDPSLIDKRLLEGLNQAFLQTNEVLPAFKQGDVLTLIMADPFDEATIRDLEKHFGCKIEPAIAPAGEIQNAITQCFQGIDIGLGSLPQGCEKDLIIGDTNLSQERGNNIVEILNYVISNAIVEGASDIHIEPQDKSFRVRYRIDGVLHHKTDLPLFLAPGVISRIKVLCGLDIAEKRRHQDGRIEARVMDKEVDLRVSTYASVYGESVVIRLLHRHSALMDLDSLGFSPANRAWYQAMLDRPSGIILVTGPTGSGKTTSLYASINYLNGLGRKIITVEDPVEYTIKGVVQGQFNPKLGLSYSDFLKSMMRQDPDVLMVGEIRDQEAAEAVIQASLTGHQVLSTFHTDDTTGALLRLMDLGIETFLISSTVVSVLAQRLIRILCPHCRQPSEPAPQLLASFNLEAKGLEKFTFYQAKGCPRCRQLGFKGRTGTHELLVINDAVRDAILARKTSTQIRLIAREKAQLVSMREDGFYKAAKGLTSLEEVLRVAFHNESDELLPRSAEEVVALCEGRESTVSIQSELPEDSAASPAERGKTRWPVGVTVRAVEEQPPALEPIPVGREAELEKLQSRLERALAGERQLVFITGEPGIGKTTLVEAFVKRAAGGGELWVGWGQCIEQYGAGEAYMPVLEALGRLCRETGGKRLIELLGRRAPTWLAQMPGPLSDAEFEGLQRKVQGTSRERMLREMAEAMEALTAETPLVLVLEDLHWSDHSTVELLSYLAQRKEQARLLLVGTYRPADVTASGHTLQAVKRELQARRRCEEIPLELLKEEKVREFLTERFSGGPLPAELAVLIHRRTDGNPLFMINLLDYLIGQGMMAERDGRWELRAELEKVEVGIPHNLSQIIERQIDGLSAEEKRALEAASVAGIDFPVAAVAAGLKVEADEIEELCEQLARKGRFVRVKGTEEWPDGTLSSRYSFIHSLYQDVLYEHVAAARRVRLHRLVGERLETAYGERAAEIASELALHFGQGRDYPRAVRYLGLAGENAARKHAHLEAIGYLTRGLERLASLADTPERTQQELALQAALGPVLIATKGWAAPQVEQAYTRARQLCQQLGETPQLFPVLFGLWAFYLVRAEHNTAHQLAQQLLRLAQSQPDPAFLVEAHWALGCSLFFVGELAWGREHLEQGLALYDPQQHRSLAFVYGQDPGMSCLCYTALTLWRLGYPERALRRSQEALSLAREFSHPFSLVWALTNIVWFHDLRREEHTAQELNAEAIALCTEQGFSFLLTSFTIFQGSMLAAQGQVEQGVAQMRRGLAAYRATGAEMYVPYFLTVLAEAYGKAGQSEEGLSALAEALAMMHKTGERHFEVEAHRLKGELLLQSRVQSPESSVQEEAEECFRQASEIARKQRAKSLELRAAMSLSRLWQRQGKKEDARQLLAEVYGWFTEGFDTADLQEAKALLEELT